MTLVKALTGLRSDHQVSYTEMHASLPLFLAQDDVGDLPLVVKDWRVLISKTDAVIVCTPEYLYNIPAVVKNALEWLTSSGELVHKPVIAMTYTPNAPRGTKAMESLINSLTALDCRLVGQLALYQSDFTFDEQLSGEGLDLFVEAITQL